MRNKEMLLLPADACDGKKLSHGVVKAIYYASKELCELCIQDESQVMHGQYRRFFQNGKIQGEGFYRNGVLDGPFRYFHPNDTVVCEGEYVSGLLEGTVKKYYASGAPFATFFYKAGKEEGRQTYYYEDGAVKSILTYRNGLYHGTVELFLQNGKPKRFIEFVDGKRFGIERNYDESGILVQEGKYDKDEPREYFKRWHSNGQLAEERLYFLPPAPVQKYNVRQWNLDGKLLREGIFRQDDVFEHFLYDEAGNVLQKGLGRFENGRILWTNNDMIVPVIENAIARAAKAGENEACHGSQ